MAAVAQICSGETRRPQGRTEMITPVANAARIVAELRERLKSEYGLADGEDVLEDTLEGQTDLPELLATMARDAVQAEDYAEAIKGRLQVIAERKSRLEMRATKIRNAIAWRFRKPGGSAFPMMRCLK